MNAVIQYYNSQIDNPRSTPEVIEKAKQKRKMIIQQIDDLIDGLENLETD